MKDQPVHNKSAHHELMKSLSKKSTAEQLRFMDAQISENSIDPDQPAIPPFELLAARIEKRQRQRKTTQLWIGRAAAVLLPLILYVGVIRQESPVVPKKTLEKQVNIRLFNITNMGSAEHRLTLDDQTEVFLSPGAVLSYPEKFSVLKRELSLSGKAFFKVKHEKSRAFIVRTGDVSTTVLGTSFWVNASPASGKTTVKVKTGKVGVQLKTASPIFLLPGESAEYSKDSDLLAKIIAKKAKTRISKVQEHPALSFNGTPIKHVFRELSQSYGIQIITPEEIDQSLSLTLNTKEKTIEAVMEEIEAQLPITYERKGKIIYIKNNK
jgi:transmembrane sensor